MGLDAMILVFWMLSFKPTFSLSPLTFIKRLFSSSLSAIRVALQSCFQLVFPLAKHFSWCSLHTGFPCGSDGKVSACNVGDPSLIPGLGRSPGEGNGNPLQYSCLESSMDWGAWKATVYGVAKRRTQLSDFTFTFTFHSAYKLNKQGDNIQLWHTPFPIWKQSVVPCPVLTVASWPAYRFLKRQVWWLDISISFRIFHSLLWSTQSKALA